jgi:glycosyltransferase involved in cell wall biosynthesis
MVGHRSNYKNGMAALRAFLEFSSRENNFRFGLVVCGGGKLDAEERRLISNSGLQNRVICTTANDEKLAALYSHATALLYPSLYEGFGLPVLEAMACGCPVITSNISSLPEVGGPACLYVNPKNPTEMADTMQRLCDDLDLRSGLKQAGYLQSNRFSWELCARATFKSYSDALKLQQPETN